ncbi:MAG: hypothetical protein JWP87_5754, partial [Labilithrix sp.]|nr:hypothetical protein [Labilithrix sp.]
MFTRSFSLLTVVLASTTFAACSSPS